MRKILAALGLLALLCTGASAAATNDFNGYTTGLDSPLNHGALVTPSDSTDLTNVSRACLVGSGGNIKLTTIGGETIVVPNVPAGWHPFRATRIWSTSTTASDISCWW